MPDLLKTKLSLVCAYNLIDRITSNENDEKLTNIQNILAKDAMTLIKHETTFAYPRETTLANIHSDIDRANRLIDRHRMYARPHMSADRAVMLGSVNNVVAAMHPDDRIVILNLHEDGSKSLLQQRASADEVSKEFTPYIVISAIDYSDATGITIQLDKEEP